MYLGIVSLNMQILSMKNNVLKLDNLIKASLYITNILKVIIKNH